MPLRGRTRFHIAQVGSLERPVVANALGLAQVVQDAFDFDLHPGRIELPGERYQLPNGTYDLDKAVTEIAEIASLAKPLILFTSLPYGDREAAEEPDCAYFSDLDFDAGVAIVSTHLWDPSRHPAGLQPYVLVQLSSAVLSYLAGLDNAVDLGAIPGKRECQQPAIRQFADRLTVWRDHGNAFRRRIRDPGSRGRPFNRGIGDRNRSGIRKNHRHRTRGWPHLHELLFAAFDAQESNPLAVAGPSSPSRVRYAAPNEDASTSRKNQADYRPWTSVAVRLPKQCSDLD
jgi:hypothetical protein